MTDLDPLLPDDELVSAVLDGEATAEEVARVEADPVLSARLETFRQLSARVAAPPAPGPAAEARDELLATAVGGTLVAGSASRTDREAAEVVDLSTRRRVPPSWVLGVAAAIAVLVLLAVPMALRDGDTDQDTAAAPTSEIEADSEGVDERGGAENAQDSATAPSALDDGADGDAEPLAPEAGATELTEADAGQAPAGTDTGDVVPVPSVPPGLPVPDAAIGVESLGSHTDEAQAAAAVTAAVDRVLATQRDAGVTSTPPAFAIDDPDLRSCADSVHAQDDEVTGVVWIGSVTLPDGDRHLLLFDLTDAGAVNGTHRLYEVVSPACTVLGRTTVS
jgi:hypothetical protein